MAFEILYQDEYIVAINKPFGYLVHRTELDEEEDRILVYDLGKALGKKQKRSKSYTRISDKGRSEKPIWQSCVDNLQIRVK
ncbi:MAG: hypothetical protein IPL23_20630 [Saprospiraceae bacterium]|nr:hypothetical protein [Saprospiraceae bacterium]